MANPLKKLAGETAIYGLSTILARIINFFFVPIYTRILTTDGYGSYAEIMSYIAVFQVVLVLGLETGCFKFASRGTTQAADLPPGEKADNPHTVFSTALSTVTTLSVFFFAACWLFGGNISSAMGYPGYSKMIVYVGGILALDAITAILFARLRYQQKALKFALFKSIKIVSELGFNLILFFVVPKYMASHPGNFLTAFIPEQIHFSYIIFAVFLSCVLCFLLFIPDLLKIKFSFSKSLWKRMMIYSIPLMIANLPGIINESADRFLFRFLVGDGITGEGWKADLGVYQAAIKLAVIMNLFIQMFRYAAEPFFFSRYREKGSNELYAKVMEYFVAFCMLIFLGIVFYMDILGLILGKDFRSALGTVPIMLIAYMVLGMLFNVSMWYKLSGQTKYAVIITLLGLGVTIVGNLAFMPLFSYWASVWVHLASCVAMLLLSAYLGQKYYPIPYKWKRILSYVAVGVVLYIVALGFQFGLEKITGRCAGIGDTPMLIAKLAFNSILLGVFLVFLQKKTHILSSIRK